MCIRDSINAEYGETWNHRMARSKQRGQLILVRSNERNLARNIIAGHVVKLYERMLHCMATYLAPVWARWATRGNPFRIPSRRAGLSSGLASLEDDAILQIVVHLCPGELIRTLSTCPRLIQQFTQPGMIAQSIFPGQTLAIPAQLATGTCGGLINTTTGPAGRCLAVYPGKLVPSRFATTPYAVSFNSDLISQGQYSPQLVTRTNTSTARELREHLARHGQGGGPQREYCAAWGGRPLFGGLAVVPEEIEPVHAVKHHCNANAMLVCAEPMWMFEGDLSLCCLDFLWF
eukprot:TRINITY_DN2390_c0_g2_i2.p1 TRINITY_DN2390_c0_g2~~TRINITY_DN2390_c0_g2_i2.p1  ORF type:complete len:289 (+),score=42.92 TRINITY_DN2390_c0_g2_i2:87-953(+)